MAAVVHSHGSERFLQNWMRQQHMACLLVGQDFVIVYANEAARIAWGAAQGRSLAQLVHPADWHELIRELQADPAGTLVASRLGRPRSWRHWLIAAYGWEPAHGWILTGMDTSRHVTVLREREALVKAGEALDWSPWSFDPKTSQYRFSAKSALLVMGEASGRECLVSHREFLAQVHPEDRASIAAVHMRSFQQEAGYHLTFRVVWPDREVRWIHSIGTFLRDLNDRPYLVGWIVDVTEDHIRAEHIRRAERLESMAILAGGIAHDFNNKLTTIQGYLALLEDPGPAPLGAVHRAAVEASKSAQSLASQLMGLVRETPLTNRPVPLGALIEDWTTEAQAQKIRLHIAVEEGLALVGDPVALGQVMENLVRNALEAVGVHGTVWIRASRAIGQDGREWADVAVEDDGPGVTPDLRDHIFEPYVSSKAQGRGLGLASTYAIVRQHRGSLAVEASREGGACFRVVLPAAPR